jgi:hypothetical protein
MIYDENPKDIRIVAKLTNPGITDVVVNGFSIKQTVFDILLSKGLDAALAEELSEEIKETFAVKMQLKQGSY